jgi:arsenate reductase
MIIVYGIPNCDMIKKTRDWLNAHSVIYAFHNYKKEGISKTKLTEWCNNIGYEVLLNKKSTTWKNLSAGQQKSCASQTGAIKIMMENNSIIKRPVIETDKVILVGYNEEQFFKQIK